MKIQEMIEKKHEILKKKREELPSNEEIYEYLDKGGLSHLLDLRVVNNIRDLIEHE